MNIYVLTLKFSFNQGEDALYPVLLQVNNELILVDCGYEGFMPFIEAAALQHGISLDKLTGIILTHHDIDHIGGAFELKAKYPHLKIYASAIEAKYISGKEKSLRLQQAERLYPSLPDEQKSSALYFQELLKNVKPVEVDYTFFQDEEPSFLQGIRIINTPGHMPGHISIYLKEHKVLVAADALVYEGGKLEIANPAFTLDLAEAVASIRKLQQYEINTIVCYHGGKVENDIDLLLTDLLTKYSQEK